MTTSTTQWRSLLAAAGIALIALAGFIRFTSTDGADGSGSSRPATGMTNLVVTIGDRSFTMTNGLASAEITPDSATPNTVRVIGEPAVGDVNRDGRPDAALLIESDSGGGGNFFYAVLAVNESGSYRATNALLLGDRIAPITVDFLDGRFVYNYDDRVPGEPVSARPSVQKSLWIRFDQESGDISAGT